MLFARQKRLLDQHAQLSVEAAAVLVGFVTGFIAKAGTHAERIRRNGSCVFHGGVFVSVNVDS